MTEFLSDSYSIIESLFTKYVNEIQISSIVGAMFVGLQFMYKKVQNTKNNKRLSFHFEQNIASIAQKNYNKLPRGRAPKY